MECITLSAPRNQLNDRQLTRLLAEYRARVYETYWVDTNDSAAFTSELTNLINTDQLPTILVVEDDFDQWTMTRQALLRYFTNVHVEWIAESSDVMAHLQAYQQQNKKLPQLILLDLHLPSLRHGLNLLQGLKSHPLYKTVPTVVVTQSTDETDKKHVLNHAADGYMNKSALHQDEQTELDTLDKYCYRKLL